MPQVIKCIEFREASISIEQAGNLLDVGSVGGQSLERFASHHDPKDSQAGKRPKDRSLVHSTAPTEVCKTLVGAVE